jgi:hypothetical protein
MIADGARAPSRSYAVQLISSRHVIPDGRGATDRESIGHICLQRRRWIPGQTFPPDRGPGAAGNDNPARGSTGFRIRPRRWPD